MSPVSRLTAALVCAAVVLAGRVSAQPAGTTSTLPWTPNGPVKAVATIGPRLYLGGSFTTVAPSESLAVGLLLTRGTAVAKDATLPVFDGDVYEIVADGAGGWFIGGRFSRVNGQFHNNLARLLPDGTLDPNWTGGVSGEVHAMAVSGGSLYVGGRFSSAHNAIGIGSSSVSRASLAVFSIGSGQLAPWSPQLGSKGFLDGESVVRDIVVAGTRVYVAGYLYLTIGSDPDTDALMSFVADPSIATPARTLFAATTRRDGRALALSGGRLFIAGAFEGIGGAARKGLASIDVSTGAVTAWNPGVQGVYALAVDNGIVYLGGGFSALGTRTTPGLGALDEATGAVLAWPEPVMEDGAEVSALFVDSDRVRAGGRFRVKGETERINAAEFSRFSGSLGPWKPDPADGVRAIASGPGAGTWVGGVFRRYGAVGRTGLLGIDLRTAALLPWDPDVRGGSVNALATYGDNWLLVGGDFLMAAGAVRGGIASFDTSSHTLTSFQPARLHPKALVVGGQTLYALETSSEPLHAIDLASGNSVAGFDPPAFGEPPEYLAIAADRLYAGGRFSTVGGQPRPGLASLDRITGSLLPWNPTLGGEMRWAGGVAVAGENLYSGFYRDMDGGIAAISLTSGATTDLGLRFRAPDYVPGYTVPSPPVAFAIQDGLLFAGGYFDRINNGPRAGLAAIDLSNNGVTGWNPGGRSPVTVLLARPGLLVAGSSSAEPALFPLDGTGTPEPPTSVSAAAVDTTATISWRPPPVGPRPTGYTLEAGTAAGLRDIATVPVSGTSLTATAPPGRYFLRVRSVTGAGAGPPSGDVELLVACQVPGAPVNLRANLAASGTLTLTWTPAAGAPPGGYLLEAGFAPGASTIVLPLPPQPSFLAVPPVGVYYIRVRSTSPCGNSQASNEISVTVSPLAAPGAPSALAHAVSGRTVTLTWAPPASGGPVTGYVLDAGTAAGSSNLLAGAALGAGTSFTAPGVAPGTYFVRLRATGPGGSSPPSAEITVVIVP